MSTTIRVALPEDAEAILTIYAPIVRDTAISFEVEPPTRVEMQERIARTLQHLPWLVCERQGEVLGYVYASPHRARAAYQWQRSLQPRSSLPTPPAAFEELRQTSNAWEAALHDVTGTRPTFRT